MQNFCKVAFGLLLAFSLTVAGCSEQPQLEGVIDIHCHVDPDSLPRGLDAIHLARMATQYRMRALVLKNHYESTASLAYIVRKAVPGIELFGGIALNLSVGGINPAAVERMSLVKGVWGRVVWMPTFDAENQVRFSQQDRPFVSVSRNGELLPEVKQVISLVAAKQLTLATGHCSPEEGLMLIEEARRQGVQNIVVTHAMIAPVRMTIPQMRQAANLGAFVEFVYNGLVGPNKECEISDYAKAIREVGPEFCIVSSDLGQPANPHHPEGLAAFLSALRREGFTEADIEFMSEINPARSLNLRSIP